MTRILFVLFPIAMTYAVGWYLPYFKAMDFFAIVLMLLAGITVGFGFANARPLRILLELFVAVGFVVLTLLGLWKWIWLIPAGFILYSIWCALDYFLLAGTNGRNWLRPVSALYSILIAAFIYVRFYIVS